MKNLFDKTPHAKMRDNDSSYDTYNNASYETYLKGELASYSEKHYIYMLECFKNWVKIIKILCH